MTEGLTVTRPHTPLYGALWRLAALAVFAAGGASLATAVEVESLYSVEVPHERGDRDRRQAYGLALDEVLMRITGSAAVAQSSEVRDLFPNPDRYVLQYRATGNDSLIVVLDGEAIEALLRQAGQPVWGSDRPLTLVWLAVDWGQGERELIGADEPRASPDVTRSIDRRRLLRERVIAAAARRGLPVLFPLLDTQDLQQVSFSDVWGGFDETLLDASRRYDSNSILVGRIRGSSGNRARWSYHSSEQRLEWSGTPEDVINQLADAFAERFAYAGNAAVETVLLGISGVDSVAAYGEVQRMLGNLKVIDEFRLQSVAGNDVRFRVQVRGGTERLASALEFNRQLRRADWLGVQRFDGVGQPLNALDYIYERDTETFPETENARDLSSANGTN